jgi:DNA-binding MarR family transcriptional regulator
LTSRRERAETGPVSTSADRDHVDAFLEEVRPELPPDLDLTVEGVVDRILGLARRLQKLLDETLAASGMSHGEWKVLSSLRWAGPPYRRSAGDLARRADLSNAAMTNRLDQLESRGLVQRLRDPDDRRGVLVELTDAGHALWEEAIGVQAEKEALVAGALSRNDREQLEALLRRLMLAFEQRGAK